MKTDKTAFVEAVKTALAAGIRKSEIAEEFSVSPATVTRWSEGRGIPAGASHPEMIRRIAALTRSEP